MVRDEGLGDQGWESGFVTFFFLSCGVLGFREATGILFFWDCGFRLT